jgi:hypothetical protein
MLGSSNRSTPSRNWASIECALDSLPCDVLGDVLGDVLAMRIVNASAGGTGRGCEAGGRPQLTAANTMQAPASSPA